MVTVNYCLHENGAVFKSNPEKELEALVLWWNANKNKTQNYKLIKHGIYMELTIIKHTSLTVENKMKKERLWMTETLGKRRTKQSEKHVTVYPLENGFQVTWTVDSKREKGATVNQRREHSIMRERRKKTKDELRFSENPGCRYIATRERKRLRHKIKQGN